VASACSTARGPKKIDELARETLDQRPDIDNISAPMANYAVWNVRLRHQWLATPLKKKRVKRRQAARVGLLDAWERNAPPEAAEQAPAEAAAEAPAEAAAEA
jgi:hypothetical protein